MATLHIITWQSDSLIKIIKLLMRNITIRKMKKKHEITYGKYSVVIYSDKNYNKNFHQQFSTKTTNGIKKIKIILLKFLIYYVSNLGTDDVSDKK
jgi:hypothetical protein